MQTPVFFIVGPVGHGKSTAREILSQLTHLKGGSCSDVIYGCLARRRNVSVDTLRQIPKEELRPTLIALGDFICGSGPKLAEDPADIAFDDAVFRHPSALIRMLYLNGYNVIDGVRRKAELEHARAQLDWNGVRSFVVHVHDPRKALIADNSEDLTEFADLKIVNEGTVEELEVKLKTWLEELFGKQQEDGGKAVIDSVDQNT
jgi:hypothetical protein